ncbi:50S ribosomal protein L25/general stress protein Ctc [Herbidospora sp. NBRC 101105]|uniref:50S ribosomal protein L25/general stress protein Ctc n=1 Tax=Herbidospora sp. NBRC 101105 TaxID=3032195 RepID=UPI00249FBD88|nr:50S ribosomal protein L25/general stress protein Ctc [Herbidospora sp. NBRC 101105]GLX98795.1 50S ribosomal protein L25 [Herbidospora sp. NBRC 101105]
MSEVKIASELRDQFGKGAARKIRRANQVPVVLYGHGTEPRHLTMPGHDLLLALRTPNVLIRIEGAVNELALPKGVQRDPIKGFLEHVDLILVRRGEKVTIEMPVTVSGDVVNGAILDQQLVQISVEAEATSLPSGVEIDVDGKDVGFTVTAGDLELPKGTTLAVEPDTLVLHVIAAPTVELPEEGEAAEAPAAEAAEEAAEGEPAAAAAE